MTQIQNIKDDIKKINSKFSQSNFNMQQLGNTNESKITSFYYIAANNISSFDSNNLIKFLESLNGIYITFKLIPSDLKKEINIVDEIIDKSNTNMTIINKLEQQFIDESIVNVKFEIIQTISKAINYKNQLHYILKSMDTIDYTYLECLLNVIHELLSKDNAMHDINQALNISGSSITYINDKEIAGTVKFHKTETIAKKIIADFSSATSIEPVIMKTQYHQINKLINTLVEHINTINDLTYNITEIKSDRLDNKKIIYYDEQIKNRINNIPGPVAYFNEEITKKKQLLKDLDTYIAQYDINKNYEQIKNQMEQLLATTDKLIQNISTTESIDQSIIDNINIKIKENQTLLDYLIELCNTNNNENIPTIIDDFERIQGTDTFSIDNVNYKIEQYNDIIYITQVAVNII